MSVEGALRFTKMSVKFAYSWPPTTDPTKWEMKRQNIYWCVSLTSAFGLFFPLLFSIYQYRANSLLVTKSVCFFGAVSGFIIKTTICKLHRKRLQNLIREMEEFLKTAGKTEIRILENYVKRCKWLHVSITLVNYMTTSFVIFGPFLMPDDQKFPTPAVYPFATEEGPIMYIVYIHQCIVGFQCSIGATIDCQVALLMWYIGARMEILVIDFHRIVDIKSLHKAIDKHQRLLRLAGETSRAMLYIAVTTITTSGLVTIFSCLQLASNQPIAVKMQFGPVALISIACLFVCSWPADNLIKVCDSVGSAAYGIPWTELSPEIMKNVLSIIRRSQKPVTVSISGFLPALSLRYYASHFHILPPFVSK